MVEEASILPLLKTVFLLPQLMADQDWFLFGFRGGPEER